jgi:hypothetical protein
VTVKDGALDIIKPDASNAIYKPKYFASIITEIILTEIKSTAGTIA